MEYRALYNKYRPQRFDEVVGQDHVVRTLAHEIVENKVAHAYLFAGPRGTGKTTSARLLAKALNCTNRGDDDEPCNECASCIGITEGTSLDVIELDAASHNKVEDIREIRVNVGTVAAAGGAHRIYILDEAHMLSRAAGNALLKTLEEPPEHVIFVLATTEPYKLLDTIRSRSQRFDFHPVPVEVLLDHLADISQREDFEPEPGGLAMVATHANGSVRDAMSLLEQVAALGGGRVEAESVARALGLADRDAFGQLAAAIADQDAPAALGLVSRLSAGGADLRRFVADALGFFRGIFLAQYAPNLEEVADESLDVMDEWRRYAPVLATGDVLRAIDLLGEALLHLRQGREERLVVELALLRLTRPETALDAASLDARIGRLENQVRTLGGSASRAAAPAAAAPTAPPAAAESGTAASSAAPTSTPDQPDPEAPFESGAEEPPSLPLTEGTPAAPVAPLVDLDLATFEAAWPAIVAQVRDRAGPRRHALLKEAEPVAVESGRVICEVPGHLPFHLEQLRADAELNAVVASLATEVLGGTITLEYRSADGTAPAVGATPEIEPETRAPTKDELLEGDEAAVGEDPEDLIADLLGGEVISD